MKISCERCSAQYDLDENRIPPSGMMMKCPACLHQFTVRRGGGVSTIPTMPKPPVPPPTPPTPKPAKREIELSRQSMNPLEGKGTLAYWDDRANQLVLYSSSQTPHLLRIGVARFLGLPEEKVRVIAPDVGGGFGYKCIVFPEDLCVAWLALRYRRP